MSCWLASLSSLDEEEPTRDESIFTELTLFHSILFGAFFARRSAKHGGINIIDTSLCRQGVTYDVIFDDRRMEAIEDLAPEQKEEIMETFNRYDINGDGDIDRGECVAACKDRSAIAKEAIDKQFEAAIQDAESQEKVAELESQKQGHYMKVDEAESQLMNMFEKADSDGDGSLSQHEFFLAEAWWMKSTLNPTKVSLF
tara:strand:- start:257 stop:853 length:597 start_codon:yes stop_codon:yes gene_type:complete